VSVTVSVPTSGVKWATETQETIEYVADNGADTHVNINLYTTGEGFLLEIAAGETNTGSYQWTLPNSKNAKTPHNDYYVKVFGTSSEEAGDSAEFTIYKANVDSINDTANVDDAFSYRDGQKVELTDYAPLDDLFETRAGQKGALNETANLDDLFEFYTNNEYVKTLSGADSLATLIDLFSYETNDKLTVELTDTIVLGDSFVYKLNDEVTVILGDQVIIDDDFELSDINATKPLEPVGAPAIISGNSIKLFIQDDGTEYDSGEDYNGLWSTYADLGHWKIRERLGNYSFNNKARGSRDLYLKNVKWNTDSIGTYVQYKLPGGVSLSTPSYNYFMAMGDGGGFNLDTEFDSFMKSDGLTNTNDLKFGFNTWLYFGEPPTAGSAHAILYMHSEDASIANDRVLLFYIVNYGGTIYLTLSKINSSRTSLIPVFSSDAGAAIWPSGSGTGGLHHLGFFTNGVDAFDGSTASGLYVDGKYYTTSGSTANWYNSGPVIDLNVNALVGCRVSTDNPTFPSDITTGDVKFDQHFPGRIYQMHLTNNDMTKNNFRTLFNLKFDIPRGPAWIDMTDRFESGGKNLLESIGNIDQVIERSTGEFYIKLNKIRAVNS